MRVAVNDRDANVLVILILTRIVGIKFSVMQKSRRELTE